MAGIDGIGGYAHGDANGTARISAARPEIPHWPERGGDEHIDDEGLAAAQSDPAAIAGRRRAIAGHRRLRHPRSLSSRLSRIPARGEGACTACDHWKPHRDG